jgi:hypothetical protein|tara:strand:+ start:7542 stop:9293 length:1752 start_codon:yes stop_codon:yes gene_type:complete
LLDLLAVGLAILPAQNTSAATFVLQNADGTGFGLNDTTSAIPVGGNLGTTIGQQRQNVVMEAGRIWGQYLVSDVPIILRVEFESLSGSILAGAAAVDVESDFANAPLPDTWYTIAQANSLAGFDLQPGSPDIGITINANNDDWYYGFDSNAAFNQTDMLDVLLHEIAHGLGFFTLTSSNGFFSQNQPDVFARLLFDQQLQGSWPDLTTGERFSSGTNGPFLTWLGPATAAAQESILNINLQSVFSLNASLPTGERYPLAFIAASFGPAALSSGFEGTLVLVNDGVGDPRDACETIANGSALNGNIALIMRQDCNFADKVFEAQLAGASAVLIYNNVDTEIIPMGLPQGFDDSVLNIPAVAISRLDSIVLLDALNQGSVTLTTEAQSPGTNNGRLQLYAPSFFDDGSSISHWSTSASPNLLMEPFINRNLRDDLDLTLTLMKDLGWQVLDIPYPHLTYDLWVEETLQGEPLDAQGDDPDNDGVSNIEEYFFAGDPKVVDPDILPLFEIKSLNFNYSFTRSLLSSDLSYEFEVSHNLLTWTTAEEGNDYGLISEAAIGTQAEEVTVRIREGTEHPFLRLRIFATE